MDHDEDEEATETEDEQEAPEGESGAEAKKEKEKEKEEEQMLHPETVFIFDWDDTLLPSHYLITNEEKLALVVEDLHSIDLEVFALLSRAKRLGKVLIVTNAGAGWVQSSAARYLPLVSTLLDNAIGVVSARSDHEVNFPDQPRIWKYAAFLEELWKYYSAMDLQYVGAIKNILSFGDSTVERDAIRAVTDHMEGTICKTIKFSETPTPKQLVIQLRVVANCLDLLHNFKNHLNIHIHGD